MASPHGSRVDPEELRTIARIHDGSVILLRPLTRDDEELMLELYNSFSPETRKRRWFRARTYMPRQELVSYLDNDYERDVAVLATWDDYDGEIPLGVGRYTRQDSEAEVAVVVRDDWQNRGVATALLRHLIEVAERHDITALTAEVTEGNEAMLHLFDRLGFEVEKQQGGLVFLRRQL
ncbi:MAG: GNAT family N-acetyltransferase [Candidatus Thermoplasmatota archaeon]|nr:GNAT family N-acetyltransferase [Candidatus Thermoplasmatota archaeon]